VTESARLRIEWEWEAAPHMKAPELRATFARLKIFVDHNCVTLVEDQESGSSRRAIAVSLYPLAEWLAYNWWFLQAESRHVRGEVNRGRSQRRHSIRHAGDGFLWPDLLVLPEESCTRLQWHPDRTIPAGRPIRFLTQGAASVDSAELRQTFGDFIEQVLERLSDCGVSGTQLAEEWTAIRQIDAEEEEYCLAAARLGLDPYTDAAKYEAEIMRSGEEFADDPDLLAEFLNIVNPARIGEDLDWIVAARREIAALPAVRGLTTTALAHGQSAQSPWDYGYATARLVRQELGLGVTDRIDVEALVSSQIFEVADRTLQAFGTGRSGSGPALVLGRNQHPYARRFTLARAIWHTLRRPGAPFLVASAHTVRQRAERAFAAELLAPAEGLAKVIGGLEAIDYDDFEQAEEHFQVSSLIVKHQIDNQLAV
jgi:hypothetical protein